MSLYHRGRIGRAEDSSILTYSQPDGFATPAYLRRGDERGSEDLRRDCSMSREASIGFIPIPTSGRREKQIARNVAHQDSREVTCRVVARSLYFHVSSAMVGEIVRNVNRRCGE